MFANFFLSPFAVTVGFMRANVSALPHIFDEVVINILVKGDLFKFIGLGHKKNWMVLCESHQDWV